MNADPLRWTFETGGPLRCGLTVADGLLVTVCDDGCAYGIDVADGTPRWRVAGAPCVPGTYPAISGGRVFLYTADRDLLALDACDGSPLWRRKGLGGEPGSSPQAAGDVVLCGRWRVHGVLADSGAEAWAPGPVYSMFPRYSPWHAGHVYVTTRQFIDTGKLWELNADSGELRSLISVTRTLDTRPVTGHGLVYVVTGNGCLLAVEPRDGTIRWRARLDRGPGWTPGYAPSAPALAGGRIWTAGPDGKVHAHSARDGTGHRTFGDNVRAWSSPVAAGDLVCVMATDGRVHALTEDSPPSRWVLRAGGQPAGPAMVAPAVAGGMLYVGSPDRHLYAFEIARIPQAADLVYARGRRQRPGFGGT